MTCSEKSPRQLRVERTDWEVGERYIGLQHGLQATVMLRATMGRFALGRDTNFITKRQGGGDPPRKQKIFVVRGTSGLLEVTKHQLLRDVRTSDDKTDCMR